MFLRPQRAAVSYVFSGIVHVGLIGVCLWRTVPVPRFSAAVEPDTLVRPAGESQNVGVEIAGAGSAADDESADVASQPAGRSLDVTDDADASDAALAGFTRSRLEAARRDAEQRTAEEQLADLTSLTQRLDRISSTESVAELSETIAPWLGAKRRADEAAQSMDAEAFDIDTAQVSDVLKHVEGETVQYVAVMVDAAGQIQHTPLDAADGESLYDVFQLMKKFPLLEIVYRKTVMGLLDRLMAQERKTAREAAARTSDEREQSEAADRDQQQR